MNFGEYIKKGEVVEGSTTERTENVSDSLRPNPSGRERPVS